MNHIIKELASKRLASDRRVFEEISLRLFEFLEKLCYKNIDLFKSTFNQQDQVCILLFIVILNKSKNCVFFNR